MKINSSKCMKCGMCLEICVNNAIDTNAVSAFIDPRLCKNCGACMLFECPGEAFEE